MIDTFLHMFNFYVEKYPETIALKFNNETLSYRELGILSSKVASSLKKNNVKAGTIIGLFFDRSIEMLVGIVGILKAGCAYLPIDRKYPLKRIEYLISDSKIENVLTSDSLSSILQDVAFNGNIHLLDYILKNNDPIIDINEELYSDSIAYVIYTSASTGTPKGVVVSHENLVYFIKGMQSVIPFKQGEILLMLAPISFDLSISETLLPLASGMTIVIANENQQRNPEAFSEAILQNGVTMIHSTPSRLKSFLTMQDKSWLNSLNVLLIGGEEFPMSLFKTIKPLFSKKMYNLYGPTETTVWSTFKDLTNSEFLSIGKALPEYYVYILDDNDQLCNVNYEGEICIGGKGVAQGYLNNRSLTKEKFVQDPFNKENIIYRTGDIGRFNSDGDLIFLGRIDTQIKVRGHRLDLSEIENKLLKIENIKDAVVTYDINNLEEKVIAAYFVACEEMPIQKLKEELKKELPEYMIPLNFISVEHIPLTFNGKIDYKALRAIEQSPTRTLIENEKDQVKSEITKTWGEILNISSPQLNDDFFETGGHSLSAIILINTISEKYNIKFPLVGFLENPTLEYLIDVVKSLSKN